MTAAPVHIRYTNWRGETAWRTILPLRIEYGSNEWHPAPQWFLHAIDVDKGVERAFALVGIVNWSLPLDLTPLTPPAAPPPERPPGTDP